MTAALRKHPVDPDFGPQSAAPGRVLLEHLRQVGRVGRAKSYVDIYGACAALSANPEIAGQAASDVLMRCLSQALGRRLILYREGVRETSFDENWLMALARSLRTDDVASATFLMNSRVPRHLRRNLVFLLKNVVQSFDRI